MTQGILEYAFFLFFSLPFQNLYKFNWHFFYIIMKFDLHVHSEHSRDSNSSHRDIIEIARKRGLDGFAICDHDTVEGGLACAEKKLWNSGLKLQ